MLDEKNDNLSLENSEIDGNENIEITGTNSPENQEIEASVEVDEVVADLIPVTEVEAPIVEEQVNAEPEIVDLVGEHITEELFSDTRFIESISNAKWTPKARK